MKTSSKMCVAMYMLLFTLLLVARDIIGISISKWLFVAVAGSLMFIGNLSAVVYMTAFSIPLLCGIPGTYIMLIAFILLVLKLGKVKANTVVICVLMLMLEFFASIWYVNNDFIGIVSYMSHVGILMLIISDDIMSKKVINPFYVAQIYIWGSCLLCAIIIVSGLKTAPENWLELYSKGWFRFGDTQTAEFSGMALTLNANNLGYYGIIGSFSAFHLCRKGYNRAFNLLAIFLHFAAGVLALSRSFLVISALCIVMMVMLSRKSIKGILGTIAGVVLLGITIATILNRYPDILTGWVTRMTQDDVTTGNGRTGLLIEYLEAWMQYPRCVITGAGVTGYRGVIGMVGAMHNAFEQILVCYGFLGSAIFLYGLVRPLIQISHMHKIEGVDWMPVICLVLFAQTIQFVNPTMLMMPYAIAIYTTVIPHKMRKWSLK